MKNMRPVLCMQRDENILKFCIEKIEISEPCSVVEINGYGIKVIYFALIEKLGKIYEGKIVQSFNAKNSKELERYLKIVQGETRPQIVLFHLTTDEDCSWFIKELENLREKRSVDFVSVVFCRVGDVFTSLLDKQKILLRSLKILNPIDLEDTLILVNDFERRFGHKLTKEQIIEIFKLSGGHVGLIKTLYLYIKEHPGVNLVGNVLLNEPSVISRLNGVIAGIPDEMLKDLSVYPRSKVYKDIIGQLNFMNDKKTMSPLFKEYLAEVVGTNNDQYRLDELDNEITDKEKNLLGFFITEKDKVVEREKVAEVIWGSDWEEQYSDWAIDQTIHRLRQKLKKTKSPHRIVTKKGRGFILQDK